MASVDTWHTLFLSFLFLFCLPSVDKTCNRIYLQAIYSFICFFFFNSDNSTVYLPARLLARSSALCVVMHFFAGARIDCVLFRVE